VGWVGKQGQPLKEVSEGIFECPVDQSRYQLVGPDTLKEINTP
jgi:hypothetical protein